MTTLADIDLVQLIDIESAITWVTNTYRAATGGPCPFCGHGEDRFGVFTDQDDIQRYYCGIHGNGCNARGDAITFLREYKQLSYHEACDELGLDADTRYPRTKRVERDTEAPPDLWQNRAIEFCTQAKETLHSPGWEAALHYLRAGRGFTDETIGISGIGYNATARNIPLVEWDLPEQKDENGKLKSIYLPRGFVIPWRVDGSLWKVVIRRTDKDIARLKEWYVQHGRTVEPSRYYDVYGSADCLYNSNAIQNGEPVFLVEGPFDAIAAMQGMHKQFACVATGGIGRARTPWCRKQLARASTVLVAYDDDSNSAGSNAAKYWTKQLPHAMRITPWSHDLNEMLLQGQDIAYWASASLSLAAFALGPRKEEPAPLPVATILRSRDEALVEQEDSAFVQQADPPSEDVSVEQTTDEPQNTSSLSASCLHITADIMDQLDKIVFMSDPPMYLDRRPSKVEDALVNYLKNFYPKKAGKDMKGRDYKGRAYFAQGAFYKRCEKHSWCAVWCRPDPDGKMECAACVGEKCELPAPIPLLLENIKQTHIAALEAHFDKLCDIYPYALDDQQKETFRPKTEQE